MHHLNEVEKKWFHSSKLVKLWGNRAPKNCPSIEKLLTIENISFWKIMSPELAIYLIPNSLKFRSMFMKIKEFFKFIYWTIKYSLPDRLDTKNIKNPTWPKGKSIIFIAYNDYLAREILFPIIKSYEKKYKLKPILISGSNIKKNHDIKYHFHDVDFKSIETINTRELIKKKLRYAYNIICRNKEYVNLFVDGKEKIWSKIRIMLHRSFFVSASYIFSDTASLVLKILKNYKPSLVVLIDTADPRTRLFSYLGEQFKIPTVQIQSGTYIGMEAIEWKFLIDRFVIAQGKSSYENLQKLGVNKEQIFISGTPRYEAYSKFTSKNSKLIKERFEIPKKNKIILFASMHSLFNDIGDTEEITLTKHFLLLKKSIISSMRSCLKSTLIIKPHPLENVDEVMRLIRKDQNNVVVADPKEDIRPLIKACDCFVSLGSQSTIDALYLNKPSICPNFFEGTISKIFRDNKVVEVPKNKEDIEELFKDIENNNEQRILEKTRRNRDKFLKDLFFLDKEKPSDKIAKLIHSLSKK